jgi:hypothetical protein
MSVTEIGIVAANDAEPAVSWKAIFAGAVAAAAVTLILVAFGVGVGFSVISPWNGEGLSATTFTIGGGIYLIVVAMLSSTIGGYLAGRMRSQWATVHEHERYFRDSAHGFVTWAFATIVTAAVLGGAMTGIVGTLGAGAAGAARTAVTAGYVDRLVRPASPANAPAAAAAPAQTSPQETAQQATSPVPQGETSPSLRGGQIAAPAPRGDLNRGEIGRILATGLTKNGTIATPDRDYLASVVAAQTGLSQAESKQRVDEVITQAKTAADKARKSTAAFAFWLAFAMLAGALSASLAAIEGGNLRNREWYLTDAERARLRAGVPAE